MMAPSEAWKKIRASVDLTPEELAECAMALDEEFGETLQEGTVEYASARLAVDGEGKVTFHYRKDERVSDRNLCLSLMQMASTILAKEAKDGE